MKVRTDVKAGEFAAAGAAPSPGYVAPGILPNDSGQGLLDEALSLSKVVKEAITAPYSDEMATLRQFLRRDVQPWLMATGILVEDVETAERQLATSPTFAKVDATIQATIQHWLDPLFGETRSRQRQALTITGDKLEISSAERVMNRCIAVSLVTLGMVLAGIWFVPPLLVVGVAGALYLTVPVYLEAYHSVINKRKVTFDALLALSLTGTWLGGYFVAGTLACLIYFLSQKLVYKSQDHAYQD